VPVYTVNTHLKHTSKTKNSALMPVRELTGQNKASLGVKITLLGGEVLAKNLIPLNLTKT